MLTAYLKTRQRNVHCLIYYLTELPQIRQHIHHVNLNIGTINILTRRVIKADTNLQFMAVLAYCLSQAISQYHTDLARLTCQMLKFSWSTYSWKAYFQISMWKIYGLMFNQTECGSIFSKGFVYLIFSVEL